MKSRFIPSLIFFVVFLLAGAVLGLLRDTAASWQFVGGLVLASLLATALFSLFLYSANASRR